MKLRHIKLKMLLLEGVVYRLHIVILQSIFWYILYGLTMETWEWSLAIGSSVLWNICNTLLYYNYHYWFARLIKIGVD